MLNFSMIFFLYNDNMPMQCHLTSWFDYIYIFVVSCIVVYIFKMFSLFNLHKNKHMYIYIFFFSMQ